MDLVIVTMDDGMIFKVQESMTFMQQNRLMELIEEFIDFGKLQTVYDAKKDTENKDLTMADFKEVLKDGAKFTTFSFRLTLFCLTEFVNEPKITESMLNDINDPNVTNYAVLGIQIVKVAFEYLAERSLLKKTPMK